MEELYKMMFECEPVPISLTESCLLICACWRSSCCENVTSKCASACVFVFCVWDALDNSYTFGVHKYKFHPSLGAFVSTPFFSTNPSSLLPIFSSYHQFWNRVIFPKHRRLSNEQSTWRYLEMMLTWFTRRCVLKAEGWCAFPTNRG
jgi:hypothetical protein